MILSLVQNANFSRLCFQHLNTVDNDDVNEDDDLDSDDDDDKVWDSWEFEAHYGKDAWDRLLQARLARHRNIILRLFTQHLPNLSEHNALLDALAHPVEGLDLFKYDQLYYRLNLGDLRL
jgi:hypothetical protein